LPRRLESVRVLIRFALRAVIVALCALTGHEAYGKTLAGLLGFAAFYCALAGSFRRERPFGPVLTHFDEAAGYAIVSYATLWVP
jgi:hypothetical protein